jgi:hypothetical protein
MAIVENKLKIIVIISIIMFFSSFVTALYNNSVKE